jgi:hypothetical protein
MKFRTCPSCLVKIPIEGGYYFDENGQMCCEACKKEIIPLKEEAVAQPKKVPDPVSQYE